MLLDESLDRQVSELRDQSRLMIRALGFLEERFEQYGCTAAQCHALTELGLRGRVTSAELAAILEVDRSTISRAIRPLLDDALVEIVPDPEDSRSKPLQLTASGRDRVATIHRSADAQVRAALSLLDEDQRAEVLRGIGHYQRALHRVKALSEIQFRPIEKNDEPDMAHVIRTVMTEFGAVGAGYSIEDEEVDHMHHAYADERSACFVATRRDHFLGGAGVGPLRDAPQDVCELRKMYILPEARGLGVGRGLLDRCLRAARELGYRECYLETLGHMTQARHLYEKNGFRPIDGPMGATGHHGCDRWYVRDL